MNNNFTSSFLKRVLDQYKLVPSQRSVDWFEKRKRTIGGSEIHYISSENSSGKVKQLLNNKFEKRKFIIPCQFGILFEEEIKKISEQHLNCNIYDVGNIKSPNIKYLSFSPDGLGVIKNEIVLFEFKCPYSRIPNNTIKNEYLQQMQLGLYILPFCNKCLYIEAVFKKCPLEQLNDPTSYYDFCSNEKKIYTSEQVSNGIIILCCNNEKDNNKNKKIQDFVDYGKATKAETELLLLHIFNSQVTPVYHNNITDIPCKIIGILPWKCFDYSVIEVPRNNLYFSNILRKKSLYYGHLVNSYPYMNSDEVNNYITKGNALFNKR